MDIASILFTLGRIIFFISSTISLYNNLMTLIEKNSTIARRPKQR